jgi:hypothetical protein
VSFETTIAAFAAALRDVAAPPPTATLGRLGAPDARRFAVYRNNVAVGLIGALEARYPVCRRIVGADFFRAMARAFARAHRPRSPVMIAYSDDFPDFAAAYVADLDLPYLGDVARLENAWVEAYHAEDARAATLDDLVGLDPAALPAARIVFHPAARLLSLATPAASIWAAHQDGADPAEPPIWRGESVLVTRAEAELFVRILPPEGALFAGRLKDGATLAEAAETLTDPDDFGTHCVGLVASGAVASIVPGERP